jgi:phenylacetate-CoA ligase
MNVRQSLYYASHRLVGSSVGRVYDDLLRRDQGGLSGDMADEPLTKILRHCARAVPYYTDLFRAAGGSFDTDPRAYLGQLPMLTKALIRQNFDRLKSLDLPSRRWSYNTSGGSTGEPIRLIQDREFTDQLTATELLSYHWAGREFGEPAVRVWGSERDILQGSMGLKMGMINRMTNDVWLNAFRMTPDRMRQFIDRLNRDRPKLIIAYAQAIYELARFAERESIVVVPQSAVMTSAGTLYSFMREKIESVFGCKVFDRYGSREVGAIACQCQAQAGMHVFPWSNYIEIVDERGLPVSAGTEGNIVVTCLTNFAMPLIRYAIGDRGMLAAGETCACGRRGQILQKLSGRNVDTFRTKAGALIDGEYFTHLLYFRDWVLKFQIIQKTPSQLNFRIMPRGKPDVQRELDEIREKTEMVMGRDCSVTFEFVDDIQPASSGKYRYTISEVEA